ncbi:hypothetical protein FISHEDRAFT_18807, partial [Fistulina hepatica ATCC 64428]
VSSAPSCRMHSTSSNATPDSFPDPQRSDLYYHRIESPSPFSSTDPAFALSFLSEKPASPESATIIGWLPALTSNVNEGAGLDDFKENPRFLKLLHRAVKEGLREGVCDIQTNGATQLHSGWMHINGEARKLPPLGRIADPDDIIASVHVAEGKIQPESYQEMPSYRLCTIDGPTKLTPGLTEKLQEVLKREA